MDTYTDRMKVRFFDSFPGWQYAREGSAMLRSKDNCLKQFNRMKHSLKNHKDGIGMVCLKSRIQIFVAD